MVTKRFRPGFPRLRSRMRLWLKDAEPGDVMFASYTRVIPSGIYLEVCNRFGPDARYLCSLFTRTQVWESNLRQELGEAALLITHRRRTRP